MSACGCHTAVARFAFKSRRNSATGKQWRLSDASLDLLCHSWAAVRIGQCGVQFALGLSGCRLLTLRMLRSHAGEVHTDGSGTGSNLTVLTRAAPAAGETSIAATPGTPASPSSAHPSAKAGGGTSGELRHA